MEYSPSARTNTVTGLAGDWFAALPRLLQIGVVLVLFSLVIFLYLAQASIVANLSLQITQCETRIQELKNHNEMLRAAIAQEERLPLIIERATALGLGLQNQVVYATVELSPAFASADSKPAMPLGAASDLTLAEGAASAWWEAIMAQFAAWMSRPSR